MTTEHEEGASSARYQDVPVSS